MSVQLSSHLRSNQLQRASQSGFRNGHSCKTAIFKIRDDIHKELHAKNVSISALLDFSKAFNTINHNILKKKLLKLFGFTSSSDNFMESYLTERTTYIFSSN